MPRYNKRQTEERESFRSVFEQVTEVIRNSTNTDLVRLHMGDTHMDAPPSARPAALDIQKQSGYNCYANTRGDADLRQRLLRRLARKNNMDWLTPHHLQITCGAIHGLYAAFRAILSPGDEVLTLAPHWHLIGGVIEEAGGRPRDLDFYLRVAKGADISALLEGALTENCAAIYLNSPNNPSGVVLDEDGLQQLADFAREHDLWVVSDEAYEDFIFGQTRHKSIATLDGIQERTISVYTFSKNMAAAGYRIGYTVAEPWLTEAMHSASSRTVYNAPSNNQLLVGQALDDWDNWFPALYDSYLNQRQCVIDTLELDYRIPDSGFYAFVNAEKACQHFGGPLKALEKMAEAGVACVPGAAFGQGFDHWFRLCYVSEPQERLKLGLQRLNQVLGQV